MYKKKICLITGAHWASIIGGAQYQVKCILDELVKNNNLEIIYLARHINPNYKPEGYTIKQISKQNRIRQISFLFDYRKLTEHLKFINPDIIYQRGLQPYTAIAAHYAKLNNRKFIFHVAHDFDVQPKQYLYHSKIQIKKAIEKKIGEYGLRNATKIITQTDDQRNFLKQYYGMDADIIMPNFHPKPIENLFKNEKPIKIVWVANFKPVKQPEIFVKLANELQFLKDTEFIMIGRPGAKNKYKDLHEKIKSVPNLKYLNELSIQEVNKILASAHIFVNTSKAEGFANTFIQAWMRKVPVVSLHVNTDNIFNDKKVGFYAGSFTCLKENIITLVKNRDLRIKIGEYAQSYAFKHHSADNINKLLSLIN